MSNQDLKHFSKSVILGFVGAVTRRRKHLQPWTKIRAASPWRDLAFERVKSRFKALFKKWPSWIRRCCFHGFLPPEGDLTTKLTMYNNSQTCKHNKKTKLWFSLFQNIIRRSPQASPTKNWKTKSAVKDKIRDLTSSSKNFERGTYKGGRGAKLLKSRICSLTADLIFQFFVGEAWGERWIMCWKFKGNQHLVFSMILYFYIFSNVIWFHNFN